MSFVETALSNEEDRLWRRVREHGDIGARNQLVERYLPYARYMAKSLFARRPDNDVEFSDYVQYASVGLIEAVDRYEASKGAMFKTFAGYRIRGAILNGVQSVTEKRDQYASLHKLARERVKSLAADPGGGADADVFAEMVDMTIGLALSHMLDDMGNALHERSSRSTDPYNGQAYEQICNRLKGAIDRLDDRQKRIVQYHYYHQMNFESLADLYGLSKGRISQLHKQALEYLRTSLRNREDIDERY